MHRQCCAAALAIRKITDLIEGVPRQEGDRRSGSDLRNLHADGEFVAFGMIERNFVMNSGPGGRPRSERRKQAKMPKLAETLIHA